MDYNTLLHTLTRSRTPEPAPAQERRASGGSYARSAVRRPALLLCLPLFLILMTGCVTSIAELETPSGFAEYTEDESYRAISADGVELRARLIENDPEQSLQFWQEALEVKMERAGYAKLAEESFQAETGRGTYFEWAAPVNGEDWVYMTALSLGDNQIVLVEAAGPFELFTRHRRAVKESLETLRITEELW